MYCTCNCSTFPACFPTRHAKEVVRGAGFWTAAGLPVAPIDLPSAVDLDGWNHDECLGLNCLLRRIRFALIKDS